MDSAGRINANDADVRLAQLVAAAHEHGRVMISNDGRDVATIVSVLNPARGQTLAKFALEYAFGEVNWPELRDEHGITYGDLLVEMSQQGLPLPLAAPSDSISRAKGVFISVLTNK